MADVTRGDEARDLLTGRAISEISHKYRRFATSKLIGLDMRLKIGDLAELWSIWGGSSKFSKFYHSYLPVAIRNVAGPF